MVFRTKRPKQDFTINYEKIISNNSLDTKQKVLLLNILIHHKVKCKRNYVHILNDDLVEVMKVGRKTVTKTRDTLEELNYFTVKVKHGAKSVEVSKEKRKNSPLYYYPNWQKLKDSDFIKDVIDPHKANFNSKVKASQTTKSTKPKISKNTILTKELSEFLVDNEYYDYRVFRLRKGLKSGYSKSYTSIGKDLKREIRINENSKQSDSTNISEYELV